MSFKGSVESFSLADVFQNLALHQRTGMLRVKLPENHEKNICFQNGIVCHLTTTTQPPLLSAEVFVALGLISRGQADASWLKHRQTQAPVAECLVDLGFVTAAQVLEVFKRQVEEEVYDLFSYPSATFEFEMNAAPGDSAGEASASLRVNLTVSHLVMEAARRVDEWEQLRELVPSLKEIFVISDPALRQSVERGEEKCGILEQRILSLMDGTRDVADVIADAGFFKFDVIVSVAEFIRAFALRAANVEDLTRAEQECERRGEPGRRIKVLEHLLALSGSPVVRREIADVLALGERPDEACAHYRALADAAISEGHDEEAIELFKRILALEPASAKSREQLADLYLKQGQKREAFVHYQLLFNTLREQNQLKEARAIATRAVECEPGDIEMRGALIELLLQADEKIAAARQLELLGDNAAKARNIPLASESYMRAMRLSMFNRRAHRELKRKLESVSLTRAERSARRFRRGAMAAGGLVCLALVAILWFVEDSNHKSLLSADRLASPLIENARAFENEQRFGEAANAYQRAAEHYDGVTRSFSPLFRYNQRAREKLADLKKLKEIDDQKWSEIEYKESARIQELLKAAEYRKIAGELSEAQELYQSVFNNPAATPEFKARATQGLTDAIQTLKRYQAGLATLRLDPNDAFDSAEAEMAFIQAFKDEFGAYRNFPRDLKAPVFIKPDRDGVSVFVDGAENPACVLKFNAGRRQNTLRYTLGKGQVIEFKKKGYATVRMNTPDLRSTQLALNLEREPAANLAFGNLRLSGEPLADEDVLYAGTSDGGLVQIEERSGQILKSFELEQGKAPSKQAFGSMKLLKRPGQNDLIVYCTRAGYCAGVQVLAHSLEKAWSFTVSEALPPKGLAAPPAYLLLNGKWLVVIPLEKRLVLAECDSGKLLYNAHPSVELNKDQPAITSTVIGINGNALLLAGASDSSLYAFTPGGDAPRQWAAKTAQTPGAAIRACPVERGGEIIAIADDGALSFFKPKGEKAGELKLTGFFESAPLPRGNTAYFASSAGPIGLWCVDLAARKQLWNAPETIGGLSAPPAVTEQKLYFGTTDGRICAMDASRPVVQWMRNTDKQFAASPLLIGRWLFVFYVDSRGARGSGILVFDETE